MRAQVLAAALTAGLSLTGCSNGDGEVAPTLPPVTATGTATPTSTAEPVPTQATAQTPEGAAEFARFFVEVVERSYKERDPEPVRALSAPTCKTCQQYLTSIEGIRQAGATVSASYGVEVLSATAPEVAPEATTTNVTVVLRVGEAVVTDPSGRELVREAADDKLVQDITLERSGSSWRVAEVRVQP